MSTHLLSDADATGAHRAYEKLRSIRDAISPRVSRSPHASSLCLMLEGLRAENGHLRELQPGEVANAWRLSLLRKPDGLPQQVAVSLTGLCDGSWKAKCSSSGAQARFSPAEVAEAEHAFKAAVSEAIA
ncbi:MAG: hypothetical protein WDN10_01705 [bacterium]